MDQKYINDKSGNHVLPITHENSVRDSQGTPLSTKLSALESATLEEKDYAPASYSGMGRKVLPKNMVSGVNTLTQAMMPTATGGNTIYVIQYDFTLGEDITIPANCVLEFDGGSISAGSGENMDTITGNNTKVICNDYDGIILSIYLNGSWDKEYFTICNFGCAQGNDKGVSNSSILNTFCNTSLNAITNNVALKVPQGVYNISTPVQLNASFDFICVGTLKYDGVDNVSALTIGSPGSNNGGYARKYVIALEGNLVTYNYDESTQQYVIPENYGLKMYGMANSDIKIEKITNFAYGVSLIGNDRGFACNNITVEYIMNSYRCLTLLCEESGYVNENLIIGGRYYCESNCSVVEKHTAIALLGSNVHHINNNVFIKPNVEEAHIGIYTTFAQDNTFIAPRTEADTIPYYNDTVQYDNVVIYGNGNKTSSMIDLRSCRYRHIAGTDNLCRIKFGQSTAYSCAPLYSANRDGVVSTTNIVADSVALGGYFIDTSVYKDFVITNTVSRAYIFIYDNNYQKIELTAENRKNYIKDDNYMLYSGGVCKGVDISFTSIHLTNETKIVYVASKSNEGDNTLHVYCTDCRYGFENLILKPFNSTVIQTSNYPSESRNVKNGEVLQINNRHYKYITYINGKWYTSDGVSPDVIRVGTTAQRPTGDNIYIGFIYIDTDLGSKPIFAKEIASNYTVTWVDATGTTV